MSKTIKPETLMLVGAYRHSARVMAKESPEMLEVFKEAKLYLQSSDTVVMCDEEGCDWESEPIGQGDLLSGHNEIYSWHNTPCPCCGSGSIITDDDLGNYVVAHHFMSLLTEAGEMAPPDANEVLVRTEFSIESKSGAFKVR